MIPSGRRAPRVAGEARAWDWAWNRSSTGSGVLIRFPLLRPRTTSPTPSERSPWRASWASRTRRYRDGLEAVTPLFGRSQVVTGQLVDGDRGLLQRKPRFHGAPAGFLRGALLEGRRIAVLGGMRSWDDQTAAHSRARTSGFAIHGWTRSFLFGAEMEPRVGSRAVRPPVETAILGGLHASNPAGRCGARLRSLRGRPRAL